MDIFVRPHIAALGATFEGEMFIMADPATDVIRDDCMLTKTSGVWSLSGTTFDTAATNPCANMIPSDNAADSVSHQTV